jgi:hypothetical protein
LNKDILRQSQLYVKPMRLRQGSSKIKYEHGMIDGLRAGLEAIESWPEFRSAIPGVIRPTRSAGALQLRVQYATASGLKCLAKSGSAVQEVFFVTDDPVALKRRIEARFPR